jgi:hypothetical protein
LRFVKRIYVAPPNLDKAKFRRLTTKSLLIWPIRRLQIWENPS